MEPIQGTNVSLAIAQITAKSLENANELNSARAGMLLDAMRMSGEQIVGLLEGLGENIDLYA